ncbi:MAG: D-glycero-beta-D-manno-heptose 1-phosphate adenylyltransferase [Candidatus Muiribacteriaceae bacterium]
MSVYKEAREYALKYRKNGKRIVFTNGCFDILHAGHVDYLIKSAELGDIFIIGLNSDSSVRRLKGENRPLNDEFSRKKVLMGLKGVDNVVVFEEDTPLELIKAILPDVLVKGGDYKEDEIVGADIVRENGGEVRVIPFLPGYSTTSLIERIIQSEKQK